MTINIDQCILQVRMVAELERINLPSTTSEERPFIAIGTREKRIHMLQGKEYSVFPFKSGTLWTELEAVARIKSITVAELREEVRASGSFRDASEVRRDLKLINNRINVELVEVGDTVTLHPETVVFDSVIAVGTVNFKEEESQEEHNSLLKKVIESGFDIDAPFSLKGAAQIAGMMELQDNAVIVTGESVVPFRLPKEVVAAGKNLRQELVEFRKTPEEKARLAKLSPQKKQNDLARERQKALEELSSVITDPDKVEALRLFGRGDQVTIANFIASFNLGTHTTAFLDSSLRGNKLRNPDGTTSYHPKVWTLPQQ